MKVRFSSTALRQIDEALSFIAQRSPRAASRLSERIQSITALVQEHPEAAQVTSRQKVRRAVLSPFPYALFYRVTQNDIVVLRLRHVARRPL